MNLSSIVVLTKPEHLDEVLNVIKNTDACEYHLHDDKGRIIVTIEGKNTEEEITKLNGKKIIFTNGSKVHAANVTKRIGIEKLFDGVFDIVDSDLAREMPFFFLAFIFA